MSYATWVSRNPNDLENWKVYDSFPIHLNRDRISQDTHTNSDGRDLIDPCKACSLRILHTRMEDTLPGWEPHGTVLWTTVKWTMLQLILYLMVVSFTIFQNNTIDPLLLSYLVLKWTVGTMILVKTTIYI